MKQKNYTIRVKCNDGVTIDACIVFADSGENGYKLELEFDGKKFASDIRLKSDENFEYALINLQNKLPADIKLQCCLSCKYGNFNPYGGHKIYCFLAYDVSKFVEKMDVIDCFDKVNKLSDDEFKKITHEVIDLCDAYEEIGGTFSYNSWTCETVNKK